ncbi:MAG: ABC transporter permease [Patescibacteria group bacterium]
MHIRDLMKSALDSLGRTKGRTALTMLGIVIGISSVILVLSISEAAERYIVSTVNSFGTGLIIVANGPPSSGHFTHAFAEEVLTYDDVHALKQKSWIDLAMASVEQDDKIIANGVERGGKVTGTMPDEIKFYDIKTSEGLFLAQEDVDARSRVTVLGYEIARELFGDEIAVGKTAKINRQNFRVIGVMEKTGTRGFDNVDRNIYIPVTAAQDLYNKKHVMALIVRTRLASITDGMRRIQDVLRDRHNIDFGEEDDFNVLSQEELVKTATQITDVLGLLLSAIAAISLVVGGIGIMNIMYVSVTERTREIGLRKALGARSRDILSQFLIEAIVLTGVGGLIGVGLGSLFSFLSIVAISSFQSGWSFSISTNGVLLGFGVSAVIGIVFGYAPARKASRLNPIEALRKE